MSRIKYSKKGTEPLSPKKHWKEVALEHIEATNVWVEKEGVKQYKELKPTAAFDLNAINDLKS